MRFKNTPSLSNYLTPKIDGIHKVLAESTERQNEKTRQKAGFSGIPEILKAFSGTLYGAGTRSRTRDLLITRKVLQTYKSMGYVIPYYVQTRQGPRR